MYRSIHKKVHLHRSITPGKKHAFRRINGCKNDYGSEDLEATLTIKNDSVMVMEQGSGSSLKIADKGKWKKLPKTLEFIKNGK